MVNGYKYMWMYGHCLELLKIVQDTACNQQCC